MERFVVEQIREIGKNPAVLAQTLDQVREQSQRSLKQHKAQERMLQRELARHNAAMRKLIASGAAANPAELANLQERISDAERRATVVRDQILAIEAQVVDEREVRTALAAFDPVWETLSPREQARIIHLLVERVDYDGRQGTISITFRPEGIKSMAQQPEEIAA